MGNEDNTYSIRCVYCKNEYDELIILTDVVYITNCKKCGKESVIALGDLNFSTEVYRNGGGNRNIITSRKN